MSTAWEGADRLSGGTGDLSERFAQELSEPITQRVLQMDATAPITGMQHAALCMWPKGDLTTTNVITAIMQVNFLHMALPSNVELSATLCRKPCCLQGRPLQRSNASATQAPYPCMSGGWDSRQSASHTGDLILHEILVRAYQTIRDLFLTPE